MSTTTAPWGMRRMTPLRNGGPVAPYVGIDPGTQTGRWIGDDVLDWRAEYRALAYEPVDCPDDLRTALARFLRHFGLRFGAFDFAVTPDGAWWFLECNPNGQWAWLEDAVGLPVTAAVADLLQNRTPTS